MLLVKEVNLSKLIEQLPPQLIKFINQIIKLYLQHISKPIKQLLFQALLLIKLIKHNLSQPLAPIKLMGMSDKHLFQEPMVLDQIMATLQEDLWKPAHTQQLDMLNH